MSKLPNRVAEIAIPMNRRLYNHPCSGFTANAIDREGHSLCKYINLDRLVHDDITTYMRRVYNAKIMGANYSMFEPQHYINNHTDSAFPDCHTMIIPVICPADAQTRLIVEGREVWQSVSNYHRFGHILPPGTVHAVRKGDDNRESVILWVKDYDNV